MRSIPLGELDADTTIPCPAPDFTTYYCLETRGRFPGLPWKPAIAGPLNRTGDDDATASTFSTLHEAMIAFDEVVDAAPRPSAIRIIRHDGEILIRVYLVGAAPATPPPPAPAEKAPARVRSYRWRSET